MIFFTYSNKDFKDVEKIYFLLIRYPIGDIVFARGKLGLGIDFENAIISAIRSAKTIVYFLSENSSFDKESGFLNKERQLIMDRLRFDPNFNFLLVEIGYGAFLPDQFKWRRRISLSEELEFSLDLSSTSAFHELVNTLIIMK